MGETDLNDTMSEIKKIKGEYIQNRSIFIKGEHMAELLKGLGATEADLKTIIQVSDSLPGGKYSEVLCLWACGFAA
jgi:hypothetical protein